MKKHNKKTVLKNKKRFILFLLTLLILVCCGFSSIRYHVAKANTCDFISVHVFSGDTLWDIASENNPDNQDLRKLVYEIKKFNNLTSYTIHAGDTLLIPIY